MPKTLRRWRPRSRLEWLLLVLLLAYGLSWALGATHWRERLAPLVAVLAAVYFLRWLLRARERLLWRLSHRLVVTYFFVAVVPVLLIAAMVVLTAYLLYGQLAGYLITTDLQARARQLGNANRVLGTMLEPYLARADLDPAQLVNLLGGARAPLEGEFNLLQVQLVTRGQHLRVPPGVRTVACDALPSWVGARAEEIVLYRQQLFLHAVSRLSRRGAVLCLSAPIEPRFLATVGQGLGPFRLLLPLADQEVGAREGPILVLEGRRFHVSNSIEPATPHPLPPGGRLDPQFTGLSKFSAVAWDSEAGERIEVPILISLATRPSLVNRHVFGTLGAAITVPLALLIVFGIVFVVLEAISFVTGVNLTRSITTAVSELYEATRRIQSGDFAARVHHRRRDQLGELADSFNLMAASLEHLIEESRGKQRLEDELEIARQVQEQLFPRGTPHLQTLQLFGICRPARVVSGDYYDYGLLGPGKLLFAIGDISGKGISAALLMATIQAAMRSQGMVLRPADTGAHLSTADLVTQLNRQLYETTSSEKYASLFCGFYDEEERTLTYTNAGHLPPVVLANGRLQRLEAGGPVVGLFADARYAEACVQLPPGTLLVAFTDGLTEAENAYGEEISTERLLRWVQAHAEDSPSVLAETVLEEIRQWTGLGEPTDDMTLLIARAL